MATIYVDSNASGANDGTSKTDAYGTFGAGITAMSAGDTLIIEETHSETLSGTVTWTIPGTFDNPSKIVCRDFTDDSLAVMTGQISHNASGRDITIESSGLYVYGLNLGNADDLSFERQNNGPCFQRWESCVFDWSYNPGGSAAIYLGDTDTNNANFHLEFLNSSIDLTIDTGNWRGFNLGKDALVVMDNFGFSGISQGVYALFENAFSNQSNVIIKNTDLSDFVDLIADMSYAGMSFQFIRCKLNSSYDVFPDGKIKAVVAVFESCSVDDPITNTPLTLSGKYAYFGDCVSTLSKYRTGGADDGGQANPYSWEMASTANAVELHCFVESPALVQWVDSGSQTITIYTATNGVTLQDDEFWFEVVSPGEGGSPTAQGTFNTTRAEPLATPANLTTDSSSTWNGTGIGTKQKIEVSINPAVAGPIEVRCYLAKPSTTVYVDPKIGGSRQFTVGGVQINESSSGGGSVIVIEDD